jgi:hypothetical protein
MKTRTVLWGVCALVLFFAPTIGGAQGQGQDELWEVTTKMEMAGMPMAMPPQTQQICQPKRTGQDEERCRNSRIAG